MSQLPKHFVSIFRPFSEFSVIKNLASGKPVDASQEMIALGMANILGSFFMAMPTTGAFTRSGIT